MNKKLKALLQARRLAARASEVSSQVGARVVAGLKRADELGGAALYGLKARVGALDLEGRARRLRERLTPRPPGPASAAAGAATDAAADTAGAEAAPPPSLGDPALAAQVYGRRTCPWTGRALNVLERAGVAHRYIDLDAAEELTLASRLVSETKQNTVPYVYLRGAFLGGYNALSELDRLGQLERATRAPGAGGVDGGPEVIVARRPRTDEHTPGEG